MVFGRMWSIFFSNVRMRRHVAMAMTSLYEPNWPNYEIGVMFKPLLSISMMRCEFLMCQHILRTPGNSCIYSLCRKFTFNDHKIT